MDRGSSPSTAPPPVPIYGRGWTGGCAASAEVHVVLTCAETPPADAGRGCFPLVPMCCTCQRQNQQPYLANPFLLTPQTGCGRFHAHSCTTTVQALRRIPVKYATVLTLFHRSCQQMHRDVPLRSMRESVKYCLCALRLPGRRVQSAILAPLSRKFAGRAEIIKTGLHAAPSPFPRIN